MISCMADSWQAMGWTPAMAILFIFVTLFGICAAWFIKHFSIQEMEKREAARRKAARRRG